MKELIKNDRSYDIVAAGEVLIDLISEDYSDHGLADSERFRKFFGGSPANVVCNMGRQKKKAAFISSVGNDGFGSFIIDKLRESGVRSDNVQIMNNCPTSLVCVTKSKGNPEFAAYRTADAELKDTQSDYEIVSDSRIFHFSAFCLSKEPSRTSVLRLAEYAAGKGCIVGFEPNFRAVMWDDGSSPMEYIHRAISLSTVIKPSEDDSFHIFGEMTCEDYCREYFKLGAQYVILTLGPDGALYYDGKSFISFPSVADKVVDTTGAGDAFWAGLYCALLKGLEISDSVEIASYFSAFKLKKTGAIADIPSVEEILNIISGKLV